MIFTGWLLPSRDMEELSVAEAAAYLGISKEAAHRAVRENRLEVLPDTDPVRLAREAVEEFHQLRQDALVASLARSHETPLSVARRVRAGLSRSEPGMPRPFAARLAAMPVDWRSLFSRAELAAATVPDGEGCRWCRALEFSAFLGLRPLEFSEARVELFGGRPCGVCGPGLLRPFMEALSRRVHPGRHRPPDARAEAAAAVPPAPRPRPAQPVQPGDDGRAMVSRRRREVQARLKDARRRGDLPYALQMQAALQALTADAAAVDYGRTAVTASSRPGALRCGHALSAGCGCPRRASTRGRR